MPGFYEIKLIRLIRQTSPVVYLKISIIAVAVLGYLANSISAAINLPTDHLDGAFQTASGLYRLDAGQTIGKDFFPYLGLGPLYALFPMFKLLGATLSASIVSTYFMLALLYLLSISLVVFLVLKPKSVLTTIVVGSLLLSVIPYLPNVAISKDVLDFVLVPGNSLKPLRATLPYIISALIYLAARGNFRHINKIAMFAGISALAMLWSNDFAFSTGLLSIVLSSAILARGFNARILSHFLLIAGSSTSIFLGLIFVLTKGHAFEFLRYNFSDVLNDQWWYFGPYDLESRVTNLSQTLSLINMAGHFELLTLVSISAIAFIKKRAEESHLAFIGASLFVGGVVACVGGHLQADYFLPFKFWALLVAALYVIKIAALTVPLHHDRVSSIALLGYLSCLGFVGLISAHSVIFEINTHSSAQNDENKFFVKELGGYLGKEWKDYLALAKLNKGAKVTEEYWGIWSAYNRTFPAWKVDSVIHALGNTRLNSQEQIEMSEIIISTKYAHSPDWQPWSLSQNYWFYDQLLNRWQPNFYSPTTVVWTRTTPRKRLPTECKINNETNIISVYAETPGYIELTFDHQLIEGKKMVLFFNNIDHAPYSTNGYASLNPEDKQSKIPVLAKNKGWNYFFGHFVDEPRNRLNIYKCNASRISVSDENVLTTSWTNSFYLTDGNWENGVSRRAAGFFVPNNPSNAYAFKPKAKVKLGNGEVRRILSVQEAGLYLNVWVEGLEFNSTTAGDPSQYKITQ